MGPETGAAPETTGSGATWTGKFGMGIMGSGGMCLSLPLLYSSLTCSCPVCGSVSVVSATASATCTNKNRN